MSWGLRRTALVRWSLILILAWSSGAKMFLQDAFALRLRETGFFHESFIPILVWLAPSAELLVALGLATRILLRPAALVLGFMSIVFTAVHAYAVIFGTVVPCGCAGVLVVHDSPWVNVFFLAVSLSMCTGAFALLFGGFEQGGRGQRS